MIHSLLRCVFGPHVAFRAEDVPGLLWGQLWGCRFEGVDRLEIDEAHPSGLARLPCLSVIQVAVAGWRGDDVVAGHSSGDRTVHTPPRLHGGVWRESAFEDLIPTDESPVFAGEEFVDPPDEIAL